MPDRHHSDRDARTAILEAMVHSHQQAIVALSKVVSSLLPIAAKSMTDQERQSFFTTVAPVLQDISHDLAGQATLMQRAAGRQRKRQAGDS